MYLSDVDNSDVDNVILLVVGLMEATLGAVIQMVNSRLMTQFDSL